MNLIDLYAKLSMARVVSCHFTAGKLHKIECEADDGVHIEVTGDMQVNEV